ncbi:MAG: hypothetical protein ICV70_01955 [Jiangellaceae bacterium]|nr:hypothetical protein [Jiangellaceae bacterium]
MAAPAGRARRAPFVALVLLLLGLGLVGLLVLNTSLQEGAFRLAELERETTLLSDRRAALENEVARLAEPAALSRRAAALGMVPVDRPEFLRLGEPGAP